MQLDIGRAVEHPVLGAVAAMGVRDLGPHPDEQAEQTVELMRQRVREAAADPGFQDHAWGVMGGPAGMSGLNNVGVAARAWDHVHRAIRFKRDEELGAGLGEADTTEIIIPPQEMAKLVSEGRAAGDCDDFSMYLAGLLEAVGIPCSFVTVAADGRAPRQYSHVYVRAYPFGRDLDRIALDASHGEYAGWECPNFYGKLREWPVCEDGTLWRFVKTALVIAGGAAGAVYMWRQFGDAL